MATKQKTVGKRKGRHPEKALSAAFIRTAKGPALYADGNGLYLKVDPSGARRWIQRLVVRKQRREIAIGSVSLVGLADARDIATQNRRIARSGGDPITDARRSAEIPTFEEAAHSVHEIHLPTWRNKKHGQQFINTLTTYAFPHIGKVSVAEVGSAHVMSALLPIWLSKPETARRVRQRIGTVMKWAIAQGWRTDNPALAVVEALPRQDTTKKQNRASLHYSQVWECIAAIKATSAAPSTKLAFEFLVLTASRSGEVRNAVWSEIDLDARAWSIPAKRMKAKKEHRVPLCDRAMEILADARSVGDGGKYLFAGSKRNMPLSDMTLLKLVRENGFNVDIHGFRTSFRTWAQEQTNYPREVAEAALAHKVGDASERSYARSDVFDKRRKMMDAWATYLDMKRGEVVALA